MLLSISKKSNLFKELNSESSYEIKNHYFLGREFMIFFVDKSQKLEEPTRQVRQKSNQSDEASINTE
jgi:hypothetical protein